MTGTSTWSLVLQRLSIVAVSVVTILLIGWSFVAPAAEAMPKYKQKRKAVAVRARKQVGTPYSYGGTSPRGFDCSGFTRWVFEGHGASLPHSAASQFLLAKRAHFKRVWKQARLVTGDLVFFHTTGAYVGHAGVYVGHGRFISSTSSHGVRVDSIHDPYYWGPRYIGATRVPALRKGKGKRP